jgi:hypothetical protein
VAKESFGNQRGSAAGETNKEDRYGLQVLLTLFSGHGV